jgi:hypothetical protein
MKVFVILVCASLSSCALVGVYGPERQAIARERLRKAGSDFAQAMNNLGAGSPGYVAAWQGQQQLDRIQQDNDWNAMLLRHQLQRDAMNQQLQQGVQQAHEALQNQLNQPFDVEGVIP